jgi:hypothetical protein
MPTSGDNYGVFSAVILITLFIIPISPVSLNFSFFNSGEVSLIGITNVSLSPALILSLSPALLFIFFNT